MKKLLPIFTVFSVFATGAFAADLTPYVGLGVVVDKAGTSAKRMGYDPNSAEMIVKNGGGDMDFDSAIAGEFTAGIKYGNIRAELEYALRSASEDKYELVSNAMMTINTSTSVKHNSYLFNLYYDFDLENSNWTPYVGAGIGLGTYNQYATVDITSSIPMIGNRHIVGADDKKKEFEWQLALGTAYNFTENWAADIAYRFNSSDVEGEFVYAHEVKLGLRYSF